MDFSFTAEQERFRRSIRDFCEEQIAPRTREIDERGKIPRGILEGMAAHGLLGITVSREYGGAEAGLVSASIAAEEIARADMTMAVAVYYLVEAGWGFLFERYGSKKAKEEILPHVTQGQTFLGIASTEPTGGSDIASLSTRMEKRDRTLLINGTKAYISGVKEAARYGGGYVTVVKTDRQLGHKGLSLCYLPIKDMPGITVTTSRQMGREGISNGFIEIKNVEIPDYYLIGEWNSGFYYAMEGFNCSRTLVAAACIGAAEKALELGMEHVKRRKAFSAPLASFEGIQFQLAEDYARLESARLLVYKAAWMIERMYSENRFGHGEINKAVAAAKLTAPTVAFDIMKNVMTWLGAYGYTKEAGIERGVRGVASYVAGAEGAQNIMRLIIARELLGKGSASF
ncbi:MAG TPA: acyl-CoA dehydrogenase family protein [Thermodesulfovibrionales bacterium]|nr:acyl-CoA dehydrogenase family protein [Thermodesulfovibrionales bacterium]